MDPRYVAFAGVRLVAQGGLPELLPVLKRRFDANPSDLVFIFDEETGRQIDFDLRGPLDEVFARAAPPKAAAARGPGRPKLGVTAREVTLLPRHWAWLERQPNGASAALRRLVEAAMKHEPARERARRVRAALSNILTNIAGDRPGYEEATRALFAGDTPRFETLVRRWPKDIRDYAVARVREANGA